MKKSVLLPLVSVLDGGAALLLRAVQLRTGFDADGLPIPGTPARIGLFLMLVCAAVVLLLLSRALPERGASSGVFAQSFSAARPEQMTVILAGVLLLAVSGAAQMAQSLQAGLPLTKLLPGALTLLMAVDLYLPAISIRKPSMPLLRELLLIPVIYSIVRLVLLYRTVSVDPSLCVYDVELLASVFLTLGFYRLSAFAYQSGKTRPFAWFSSVAVVFCLATLADQDSLGGLLFYLGGAVTLLGFLLLHLNRVSSAESV